MKNYLLSTCFLLLVSIINSQTPTITIHPNNRVAALQLSPEAYREWLTEDHFNNSFEKLTSITKEVYNVFDDDFDFIFLILNEEQEPAELGYSGIYSPISNQVEGIGKSVFNRANAYGSFGINGSSGKLKGVMQLNSYSNLLLGPSLHELMHQWANNALETSYLTRNGNGDIVSANAWGHWGFTGGNTKGQLGGFEQSSLQENGNKSYTVGSFGFNANGGNSKPYTEFEQYLMGIIPVTDVTPFDVFNDLSNYSYNDNDDTETFTAGKRTTYTPEKIEAELGKRIPNYNNAQKDFKLLVLVLTDAPLSTERWAMIDEDSEIFSRNGDDGIDYLFNFWEATNGRATIETGNLNQNILSTDTYQLEEQTGMKVYPVPAKDQITVSLGKNYSAKTIKMYDTLGQEVLFFTNKVKSQDSTLNVAKLQTGLYTLEVTIPSIGSVYKVVAIQ